MKELTLTDRQQKLFSFVKECHGDQVRKYTGLPYWTHLFSVAQIVSEFIPDGLTTEAAICHDLYEDTKYSESDLMKKLKEIGYVADERELIGLYVFELTDYYTSEKFPELNRKDRKERESKRMGEISQSSQSVKYADIIDNTTSIVTHDPGFARIYLQEIRDNLNHMRSGDINLLIKCCSVYQEAVTESSWVT